MGKATVLVIDDDAFSRRVVASRIERLDAVVTEAEDGMTAFRLLHGQRFDLVILDLEMPNMNGYELLGCIRGAPSLKHLPVIVLTAKEDRTSLERALVSGATSYLVKPLNWTAFGAHITHLLQLARSARRGAESPNVAVA